MKCVVVGSGPSGVNAALTLLRRGKAVELWDVGMDEPALPCPQAGFHELKGRLADPQAYFLGRRFEALLPPGSGELLRYPPSRGFLLGRDHPLWPYAGDEFMPQASFARGGLGAGWGANALSFDDDDLRDWPIGMDDLGEAYAEACRRLPIAGPEDALCRYFPGVAANQPPVRLNRHDADLLAAYGRHAQAIQTATGIHVARARIAVVTAAGDGRACTECGRCLWGCPAGSLYHPAQSTLAECQRYPGFSYRPGRLVLSFQTHAGRVTGIRYLCTETGQRAEAPCDAAFLAAGALQTGAIFLRTLQGDARFGPGAASRTSPVLDTRVIKLPYVYLAQIGRQPEARQFQFNRLIVAHRRRHDAWPTHCHGEILSLNTLLYHPLIEAIPFGSRLGMRAFARLLPALGVVTYFLPDRPAHDNGLSLVPDPASPTGDRLHVHYREHADKEALAQGILADTRRALLRLGCLPWQPQWAPPGAGIHYAGTVPMGAGHRCADAEGKANAYDNLYICDGAAFPTLPSKSITLNLIAHAIRVTTLARL
jgi:choline dehydrogenase-like flavoprotein